MRRTNPPRFVCALLSVRLDVYRMMTRITQYTAGLLLVAMLAGAAPPSVQAQTMDDKPRVYMLFDQLEYAPQPAERPIGLEAMGWVGGDVNRAWLRAEGEKSTLHREGETEIEVLYGRLISPFFDVVVGPRVDTRWGGEPATRGHLALGVQGLAPYRFEVEPTLYVSHRGNVSAEFTAAYHVLFTQRLKLETELETKAALQDVPEWGVGTGMNTLEIGARLRYEFHRKFGPYIGYTHDWAFAETADLAGGDPSSGALVVGVRVWR